ncbi:acyltransferase [Desulfogranum mediterraneum]|uniref:acyltransferase n=1 Tax=Desulfogranum mediterraneum TaxID=160661 RepID=UPI000409CA5A|nr:DapH/DapD/GlmU-related protein [Desulfogranum mediterraneum]
MSELQRPERPGQPERPEQQGQEEILAAEGGGQGKTALQSALTDERKSGLQKYQQLVIGQGGVLRLLFYELLILLIGPLPGAAGLLLRAKLYPLLFGSVGRNVVFGRSMTIRHPHKIHLGDNVVCDDYTVLDAKGEENRGIVIGDNVMIGRSTVLSCKNGDIFIGDNSNIALGCFIQSAREVHIGSHVLFAAYCYVIGGGDHQTQRLDIPILSQGQVVRGVTIEDNCWLGGGVMVQDGAVIGRDSIIGSGAVVRGEIPPFSVAAGVPARVKKSRQEG